ncbi:MAG: hypothetical protein NZM42_09765 [Gemmatales bacterium]|nr:hypothetical protein [Gemmatales bacterium]MDW8222072.1 hypothetical protein [Gemmatales bacterium]
MTVKLEESRDRDGAAAFLKLAEVVPDYVICTDTGKGGSTLEEAPRLAFLTMQPEGTAILGALLVTNHWGRPLEFHITQPVQPTKLQQILYGPTLQTYLYCEVLGKALLDKADQSVHLLMTDFAEVLRCTLTTACPVIYVSSGTEAEVEAQLLEGQAERGYRLYLAPGPADSFEAASRILRQLHGLDLLEPFERIREALRESRRLGVIARAA